MRVFVHRLCPLHLSFLLSLLFVTEDSLAQKESSLLQQELAVVPGRPSVADPAAISVQGALEVEFGLSHKRQRSGESEVTTPVVFKFSLSDRFQLRASSDGVATMLSRASGSQMDFINFSLGAQYVLLSKQQAGADAAIRLESSILNENDEYFSSNFTCLGLYSKDLGDPHIDINIGYSYQNHLNTSQQSQWLFAAALDGALSGPWRWAGEFRGIHTAQATPLYGLAAVTYQPHPAVSWDFGAEFGLNRHTPRLTLFAGVVFIFLK